MTAYSNIQCNLRSNDQNRIKFNFFHLHVITIHSEIIKFLIAWHKIIYIYFKKQVYFQQAPVLNLNPRIKTLCDSQRKNITFELLSYQLYCKSRLLILTPFRDVRCQNMPQFGFSEVRRDRCCSPSTNITKEVCKPPYPYEYWFKILNFQIGKHSLT